MADFDVSILLKNLSKSAKDYGVLMGQRNALKIDQLANERKLQQNWLWKQKEMQAEANLDWQNKQRQLNWLQKMQGGGNGDFITERMPSGQMMGGADGTEGYRPAYGGRTWSPVRPEIDIGAVMSPERRTFGMTATGPTAKPLTSDLYTRSLYQQYLKLEQRRALTEEEQTQKANLETKLNLRKEEKLPAYAEQVRTDVQTTIDRILSGEDYDTEIRNLKLKHPTGLSFDDLNNLKVVRQQTEQVKRQAIQELRNSRDEQGDPYPTTPANIKAAMQQLYQLQKGQ